MAELRRRETGVIQVNWAIFRAGTKGLIMGQPVVHFEIIGRDLAAGLTNLGRHSGNGAAPDVEGPS